MPNTKFSCPYCGKRLPRRERGDHIVAEHPEHVGTPRAEQVRAGIERWIVQRVAVEKVFGWRCLCCGRTDAEARADGRGGITIDHVVPVADNGADDITNWQPLCRRCNEEKGATYVDYRPQAIVLKLLLGPQPCAMTVIGKMRWCTEHAAPWGHHLREAIA